MTKRQPGAEKKVTANVADPACLHSPDPRRSQRQTSQPDPRPSRYCRTCSGLGSGASRELAAQNPSPHRVSAPETSLSPLLLPLQPTPRHTTRSQRGLPADWLETERERPSRSRWSAEDWTSSRSYRAQHRISLRSRRANTRGQLLEDQPMLLRGPEKALGPHRLIKPDQPEIWADDERALHQIAVR